MRPGAGWLLAIVLALAGAGAIGWALVAEPGWRALYPAGSSRSPATDGASVAARLLAGDDGRAIELTHPVDFAELPVKAVVLRISTPDPEANAAMPEAKKTEETRAQGSAPRPAPPEEKEPACPPGSG
ncbi:MAG: hypothetical protein JXP34_19625 [Planctomycetes bacterium]|nr:hypothetical protein [Planctomycetota bacterium]